MKKLLIVVDYQNDFVTGSLGFEGARSIASALRQKIESYRSAGQDVVYTLDTHGEGYLQTQEGKRLPISHCIKGSEGWKLSSEIAGLLQGCTSFCKGTFGSLELAKWLEGQAYDQIELCGVVTNICVLSNAVLLKAALPEAQLVVDARCVASNDDKANEEALDMLQSVQVEVVG